MVKKVKKSFRMKFALPVELKDVLARSAKYREAFHGLPDYMKREYIAFIIGASSTFRRRDRAKYVMGLITGDTRLISLHSAV